MSVMAFDSFDEMQAHMKRAENQANLLVTPEQQAIKPGDYVKQRLSAEYGDLVIMGKTFTVDEWVAREKALAEQYPEDGPFDEDYQRRHAQSMVDRGYLEGWWSSAWEAGEWGSVHRYNMERSVTKEEYDAFLDEVGGSKPPAVGRAF